MCHLWLQSNELMHQLAFKLSACGSVTNCCTSRTSLVVSWKALPCRGLLSGSALWRAQDGSAFKYSHLNLTHLQVVLRMPSVLSGWFRKSSSHGHLYRTVCVIIKKLRVAGNACFLELQIKRTASLFSMLRDCAECSPAAPLGAVAWSAVQSDAGLLARGEFLLWYRKAPPILVLDSPCLWSTSLFISLLNIEDVTISDLGPERITA